MHSQSLAEDRDYAIRIEPKLKSQGTGSRKANHLGSAVAKSFYKVSEISAYLEEPISALIPVVSIPKEALSP